MKRILICLFWGVCICGIIYCGCTNSSSKTKDYIFNVDTIQSPFSCVEMNVVPNEYASNDSKITLVIGNNCSSSVIYGYDYSLEYYNAQKGQWEEIVYKDVNIVFDLIAIELNPHASDTLDICLYPKYHKFIPGMYRVVKEFKIENKEIVLKADFFVMDNFTIN